MVMPPINMEVSVIEKAGYKTTEFWLSLVTSVCGFVIASGALNEVPADSVWVRLVAALVAGLSQLGYTASRGRAKEGLRTKVGQLQTPSTKIEATPDA